MSRFQTVLLADDHPLFRAGVRQALDSSPDFKVVAEVGDGHAALVQIENLRPDFALLDLAMPGMNGFELLKELAGRPHLQTLVLIISMHAEMGYAMRAKELGAVGFIAKEDAAGELLSSLQNRPSSFFTSPSVGAGTAEARAPALHPDLLDRTTETECIVLSLLGRGMTSKEIARELGVSPRTVQAHRRNVVAKLELAGPNRLMEFAVRNADEIGERCLAAANRVSGADSRDIRE